jgi:hypothetical protein
VPCSAIEVAFFISVGILGVFTWAGKASVIFIISLRLSACIKAAETGRISLKFIIGDFLEILSRDTKFARFQASAAIRMRSSLFWDISQL